jgi:hypothetical protein
MIGHDQHGIDFLPGNDGKKRLLPGHENTKEENDEHCHAHEIQQLSVSLHDYIAHQLLDVNRRR